MIKRPEAFLRQVVLLLDLAVLVIAFVASYEIRQSLSVLARLDLIMSHEVLGQLKPLDRYLWLLLVILPLWIGGLSMLGAYRKLRMKSYLRMAWVVFRANLFGLLFFGSIVFLFKLHYISRSFMGLFFVLGVCLLWLERALLIACFHLMLRRGYFHRNLLIVGTGPRARAFIQAIQNHAEWGLRIIGLVDDDLRSAVRAVVGQRIAGVTALGTLAQLPGILRRSVVDEVIFVVPRSWMARIEPAILACERVGVRATVAVDLFNTHFARTHASEFDGIPLISFDTTPMEPWQLAIKRLVDVVVAAACLVLLLPVFLLIAVLIKGTSPGPVFFRQVRCGLNGRRFTLYKFRSMVADAEDKQAELLHLNELHGPVFKLTNDPRLTPLGKWLRKASLDELPQLVNVLKGQMSLVGPRPPIPSEVEQYEPWQRRRLSMRPGVTGAWQVNGRNHLTDFNDWLRLDLEYIDRWSLRRDVQLLLKTIPAVLLGNGAK